MFSVLDRKRTIFHLTILESLCVASVELSLCKKKEFCSNLLVIVPVWLINLQVFFSFSFPSRGFICSHLKTNFMNSFSLVSLIVILKWDVCENKFFFKMNSLQKSKENGLVNLIMFFVFTCCQISICTL